MKARCVQVEYQAQPPVARFAEALLKKRSISGRRPIHIKGKTRVLSVNPAKEWVGPQPA